MTTIGNQEQNAKIQTLMTRFGVDESDVREVDTFELPAGYVCVILGEQKGRPITFGIDEHGRASS